MYEEAIKEISDMANSMMADWPSSRNKQKRFVLEYIATGFTNATEAAKNAGYSEKTATKQASQFLSKLDKTRHISEVVDEVKKAFEVRQAELKIADGTEVLQHLTRVLRREEQEHQVITIRTKEEKWVVVDDKGTLKKQTVETEEPMVVPFDAKISDSNKAAELLGKRYAMWTDKIDQTNTNIEINLGEWDDDDAD